MTAADVWTLAAHAREQIEHSPIADPHLLARKVALSIPDEHLRDAVGGHTDNRRRPDQW